MTDHGWKPIETAPKDGTPILVWVGDRLHEAIWDADAYDPATGDFSGLWMARWTEIDSYGVSIEGVTHWMPLPERPGKDDWQQGYMEEAWPPS